ncbi:MAG: hypothetical protein IPP98_07685 [Gemmatimonadetes bacterium]|nr:hypothetical protein [Gemmatimonadota bacterium]MBL0178989.1 hypothetical protein [Gemmatimonadota bacterium]
MKPWKVTMLAGLWVWAVAYAGYFGVLVWTDPGLLLYAGHAISLIFYGVPLLLLVLISWPLLRVWTRRPQRMPLIFLAVWGGMVFAPLPPMPTSHWTSGMAEPETTVSWLFLAFAAVLSVMPLLLSLGMLRTTIRARRHLVATGP